MSLWYRGIVALWHHGIVVLWKHHIQRQFRVPLPVAGLFRGFPCWIIFNSVTKSFPINPSRQTLTYRCVKKQFRISLPVAACLLCSAFPAFPAFNNLGSCHQFLFLSITCVMQGPCARIWERDYMYTNINLLVHYCVLLCTKCIRASFSLWKSHVC